jgi:hypothetical protein
MYVRPRKHGYEDNEAFQKEFAGMMSYHRLTVTKADGLYVCFSFLGDFAGHQSAGPVSM